MGRGELGNEAHVAWARVEVHGACLKMVDDGGGGDVHDGYEEGDEEEEEGVGEREREAVRRSWLDGSLLLLNKEVLH